MVEISLRFTTYTQHKNVRRADSIKISDCYCASKWVCVRIFYEQDLHAHIIYYPESRVNHRVIFKPDCLCLLRCSCVARFLILLTLLMLFFFFCRILKRTTSYKHKMNRRDVSIPLNGLVLYVLSCSSSDIVSLIIVVRNNCNWGVGLVDI